MESPRKNNDCYFYYYSKCNKGDSCTFRHEPSALGCETVCSFWKEGKCVNTHCNFRHMELRKNRKAIPCYWEAQPGGCLKPHCPFFHKTAGDTSSDNVGSAEMNTSDLGKSLGQSTSQGSECDRFNMVQFNDGNFGNSVDPLVVNFEEESDNESASTISPSKVNLSRTVKVKTLEEIRLDKIQAESAAYYSYQEVAASEQEAVAEDANDLRKRIMKRLNLQQDGTINNFEVLSLDEIRRRKKRKNEYTSHFADPREDEKVQKVVFGSSLNKFKKDPDISSVKVKSLAEIRAEKLLAKASLSKFVEGKRKAEEMEKLTTCSEVSSTSNMEEVEVNQNSETEERPAKRLKRKVSSSTEVLEEDCNVSAETNEIKSIESNTLEIERTIKNTVPEEVPLEEFSEKENFSLDVDEDMGENKQAEESMVGLKRDISKIDDILLLDEEDMEDTSINYKAEEEIFNDIDNLLND